MPGSWEMIELLQDGTDTPFGLSPQQAKAVIGTHNVFVQACPGSGKTRSVAARVAWMQQEKKRLALLSFTRVGAEEISRAALRDHNVTVAGESFVGTVQSFLQKYVLTPFAHLVTGSSTGVRIDPEHVEDLDPAGLRTSNYHFILDGSISANVGINNPSRLLADQIARAKLNTAKQGFVGLEDDVYWSFRTLNEFPDVRQTVAARFHEIIVDEAQDLDAVQIECLRLLKGAGLDSLVLVGDYDQTIYQWRGSNPVLCEDLAKDVGLDPQPLNENYRSSQVICDVAAKFRFDSTPDNAVGTHRDCTIPPIVIRYTPGEEKSLPGRLERLADHYGIVPESSAILVRRQAVKEQITGTNAPTIRGTMKTLLSIKQAMLGPSLDQYKEVERILLRRAFGTSTIGSALDWHVVRTAAISIIDELPSLEGNLLDWAEAADAILNAAALRTAPAFIHDLSFTSFPESWREISVAPLPTMPTTNIRVDTVFAFKGESIDAVMLVAGDPTPKQKNYGYGDASSWSGHLNSVSVGQDEEVRVAYVAVTRAQRLCVLALPHETRPEIFDKFAEAGFHIEALETVG